MCGKYVHRNDEPEFLLFPLCRYFLQCDLFSRSPGMFCLSALLRVRILHQKVLLPLSDNHISSCKTPSFRNSSADFPLRPAVCLYDRSRKILLYDPSKKAAAHFLRYCYYNNFIWKWIVLISWTLPGQRHL